MTHMTNEEYKRYIFEEKRKGRTKEQIESSLGMNATEFNSLLDKIFGNYIVGTTVVEKPAVKTEVKAATTKPAENKSVNTFIKGTAVETKPEKAKNVEKAEKPKNHVEEAKQEEDTSWMD